jgi:hypothetical protein
VNDIALCPLELFFDSVDDDDDDDDALFADEVSLFFTESFVGVLLDSLEVEEAVLLGGGSFTPWGRSEAALVSGTFPPLGLRSGSRPILKGGSVRKSSGGSTGSMGSSLTVTANTLTFITAVTILVTSCTQSWYTFTIYHNTAMHMFQTQTTGDAIQ